MLRIQHILDFGRFARDGRHQAGNAVHLWQGHIHGPPHITDGRPRPQCAKGDDLRHLFRAITSFRISHHQAAGIIWIIQVNIRHRDAPWIEETLKNQAVDQRIQAGNAQRVRYHRTGARPAHIPPDVVLFPLLVAVVGERVLMPLIPIITASCPFA